MAALWALLIKGPVIGSEFALGIRRAAVEDVAAPVFLFHHVAFFAIRALHPNQVLLDVLAIGISAARCELAEAAVTQNHIAATLRAFLIQGNIGDFFALIQPARGLAVGIPVARHELAKASALEDHDAAAVLAVLFLRGLLQVGGIKVRQVNGVFFGKGAAIGIIFFIAAAGKKRPVFAPFDDQRQAAAFALLVGRLLHAFDVLHVLLGIGEIFGELLVETLERVDPCLFALFAFIQLFFQTGGVCQVESIGKVRDPQNAHDQSYFSANNFAADLLHILPLLDGADNRRVGRRPSDAALFQFFDQRSFVVPRRRLGKMLLRLEFIERKRLSGVERGSLVLERRSFVVRAILGLF